MLWEISLRRMNAVVVDIFYHILMALSVLKDEELMAVNVVIYKCIATRQ